MIRPRKLLVEGNTDKRVIPFLMEANGVEWEGGGDPTVYIETQGSVDEILKSGVIESELNATGLQALGVIVDANGNARARWNQVRERCRGLFPELPESIPEEGLDVVHPDGMRFGVWVMPNNRFTGMLEDFLVELVPERSGGLYEMARNCVADAANAGAPFKEPHTRKAELHTWLAWQDEPGRQLHEAVHYRILDPESPESVPFVRWFRSLFDV